MKLHFYLFIKQALFAVVRTDSTDPITLNKAAWNYRGNRRRSHSSVADQQMQALSHISQEFYDTVSIALVQVIMLKHLVFGCVVATLRQSEQEFDERSSLSSFNLVVRQSFFSRCSWRWPLVLNFRISGSTVSRRIELKQWAGIFHFI